MSSLGSSLFLLLCVIKYLNQFGEFMALVIAFSLLFSSVVYPALLAGCACMRAEAAAVDRARALLKTLEVREGDAEAMAAQVPSAPATPPSDQLSLFREFLPHPAVETLRNIDLDGLTPLAAFDRLRELIDAAKRDADA